MATVNSVLGPIDTADLGYTLSHEHVSEGSAGIRHVYPELLDRQGTIEAGVAQLREAYQEGVRTIVDGTTLDLGRDIRLMEEVSRRSGVQIIAATGTWLDIPRVFWTATPDVVADLYVREIEVGIEDTGIRAGVIKVANDVEGVTPPGEIILRAAARAHLRTGVPISTHTAARARVGEQQVAIFEDEGVDLVHVYIGHSNDTTDMGYLVGLLQKGVWIGLDRYPGGPAPDMPNWEERTETAKRLIDAGFGHRIMISHDHGVTLSAASRVERERRCWDNPDGYLFIQRRVLPRLRDLGVPEEQVQRIMIDNPRRYFEGSHD